MNITKGLRLRNLKTGKIIEVDSQNERANGEVRVYYRVTRDGKAWQGIKTMPLDRITSEFEVA